MTKKEFEKIYDKAVVICGIKCVNRSRREAIKAYKKYIKEKKYDYANEVRQRIRKDYYGYECYECRCLPDKEYMLKMINK
jgi:hypothetical protein